MTPTPAPLATRFADHVRRSGGLKEGESLLVALSGGLDSVTLLHLLRFTPGLPAVTLAAVHVDHGMRPGSRGDAAWVKGLCGAWGIPVDVQRLAEVPANEAEARSARYAVLDEVRRGRGADRVLTAHHADDQAETVLFRALRGTGLRGLRGIAERRAPAVWRPLLPFTRREIVEYARQVGLGWREDPTNEEGYARNVLRHRVLPLVEGTVAPGARRALRGLARRARDEEAAWRSLEPELLARLDLREERLGYSIEREACLALHPGVRARMLRALVRRLGESLDDTGTRLAVEFTSSASSGGGIPLGRGIRLHRKLDRLAVVRGETPPPDRPVTIPGPGGGEGRALLGGRAYRVAWDSRSAVASGEDPGEPEDSIHVLGTSGVAFPLTVRGWQPGDRLRLAYGSKKLKKLFLEARVPVEERFAVPVLVDAAGTVLWVMGVARSVEGAPSNDERRIHIRITHAESD